MAVLTNKKRGKKYIKINISTLSRSLLSPDQGSTVTVSCMVFCSFYPASVSRQMCECVQRRACLQTTMRCYTSPSFCLLFNTTSAASLLIIFPHYSVIRINHIYSPFFTEAPFTHFFSKSPLVRISSGTSTGVQHVSKLRAVGFPWRGLYLRFRVLPQEFLVGGWHSESLGSGDATGLGAALSSANALSPGLSLSSPPSRSSHPRSSPRCG